jgi:plastocyanin
MNLTRYLGIGLLFVLMGCQGMPTVTRSGDVKDIIIGDNLTLSETAVNAGQEVRWINKRTAPVRVIFLDTVLDKQLSCKNNMGGWMIPSNTAQLATNQTASVCFRDPGYFRYIVRMESAKTTGDISVQGVIKVGGQGGQAVGQTSDQDRGRTSQKTGHSGAVDNTSTPNITTSTTTTTTTTEEQVVNPSPPQ